MRIPTPFQNQQSRATEAQVHEIQERIRALRDQIGRRDLELSDLFALVREDERPILRQMSEKDEPAIERLWPDQVPAVQYPESPEEASSSRRPSSNEALPTTR